MFPTYAGWTGLFCPCVLFGRNVERLRDDTPWTSACICHAIFIEGGIALAAATAAFHGINPGTSFLICEGLLFSWWLCAIYTGLVRQSLQKKYQLKVTSVSLILCMHDHCSDNQIILNIQDSCSEIDFLCAANTCSIERKKIGIFLYKAIFVYCSC